ncbi:flagellar basal-body rod protein FlgG [Tepidanaerobacter syntrophicus]|uniref:flagellar basal-body rod protein FlgG n=1 Tax=Tepidanaerobacter syntrophicus TaxID=224999 RepID=UPI001BD49B81|nr:flagellar basal-body rod protein FlgG [Tepidanaerobacter syntrophicus]GLI51726.1 flagellar basal-body rod protein FlgG [Tepidanaerobacter syntrophicus]
MMRALWSASSGMQAQQLNMDVTSNNLANVNTAGFKKSRAEFKDLIYETLKQPDVYQQGLGTPVGLQVGLGVKPSATGRDFSEGNIQPTGNTFDVAIEGQGFFMVEKPDEKLAFTRDGSFKLSLDGTDRNLVTSEGYYVLGPDEDYITIPEEYTDVTISSDGLITGQNEDGTIEELGQIGIVKFLNPEGLLAIGDNLYEATAASGDYIPKEDPTDAGYGTLAQGFLEMSNVQVVEEMVNLIIAQRAYEVNTKAVQASDEMLSQANNLKR